MQVPPCPALPRPVLPRLCPPPPPARAGHPLLAPATRAAPPLLAPTTRAATPPAGPPRPVLHRALPSPTPQNTPQGTGANGITPER